MSASVTKAPSTAVSGVDVAEVTMDSITLTWPAVSERHHGYVVEYSVNGMMYSWQAAKRGVNAGVPLFVPSAAPSAASSAAAASAPVAASGFFSLLPSLSISAAAAPVAAVAAPVSGLEPLPDINWVQPPHVFSATSVNITGLTPGTAYVVRVAPVLLEEGTPLRVLPDKSKLAWKDAARPVTTLTMDSEVVRLRAADKPLRDRADQLAKDKLDLQKRLVNLESRCAALESTNRDRMHGIDELVAARQRVNTLESKLREAHDAAARQKEVLNDKAASTAEVATLMARVASLQAQLDAANAAATALAAAATVASGPTSTAGDADAVAAPLRAQVAALQAEVAALTDALQKLREAEEAAKAQTAAHATAAAEATEAAAAGRDEVAGLRAQLDSITERLNQQEATLGATQEQLSAQIAAAQAAAATAEQAIAERDSALAQAQNTHAEQLRAAREQAEANAAAAAAAAQTVAERDAALAQANTSLTERAALLQAAEAAARDAAEAAAANASQAASTAVAMAEIAAAAAAAQHRVATLEGELVQAQAQLAALTSTNGDANATTAALQQQVEQLRKALIDSDASADALRLRLETDASTFGARIHDSEHHAAAAQAAADRATAIIADLQAALALKEQQLEQGEAAWATQLEAHNAQVAAIGDKVSREIAVQLTAAAAAQAELQARNTAMQAEVENLQAQNAAQASELAAIRRASVAEVPVSTDDVPRLRAELELTRHERDEMRSAVSRLEAMLASPPAPAAAPALGTNAALEEARAQVKLLQQQLAVLNETNARVEEENGALNRQCAEHAHNLAELREVLRAMESMGMAAGQAAPVAPSPAAAAVPASAPRAAPVPAPVPVAPESDFPMWMTGPAAPAPRPAPSDDAAFFALQLTQDSPRYRVAMQLREAGHSRARAVQAARMYDDVQSAMNWLLDNE